MGGALKGYELDEDQILKRVHLGIERAREGDDELRWAFKMLQFDVRDEKALSEENLLERLVRAGDELDEKEADKVARLILGDAEELRG